MNRHLETKSYRVEIVQDPTDDRVISQRWYNEVGRLERPGDLPAEIDYCPEVGTPISEKWHNGTGSGPHRDGDKPAYITTSATTGTRIAECYMIMGEFHRDDDKPAIIYRDDNGSVEEVSYWRFGKLHRDPSLGPAEIKYDVSNGQVTSSAYFVSGTQISVPSRSPKPKSV